MRLRRKKAGAMDGGVPMTPLIDCVFLLLIFFLVTSQLKRFERQIPITLADPTASVGLVARADAFSLGLGSDRRLYREAGRDNNGVLTFAGIADADLEPFLESLVVERGRVPPVELVVEAETDFQDVIDLLDRLQLLGFFEVRPRMRNGDID